MKNKSILKILALAIVFIGFCGIKNIYCAEGTLRMEINNGTPWTNISISESYEECENLNKVTSTLGTSLLQAHLTTNEDWSAMTILSVSQYGGTISKYPTTTTGNSSGVYNITRNLTQTTGLSAKANQNTNPYISGLFNEDGTTKKYVKTWDLEDREGNNFVAFQENGTYGWYGDLKGWRSSETWPVFIQYNMFGIIAGYGYWNVGTGENADKLTFRPVIWN